MPADPVTDLAASAAQLHEAYESFVAAGIALIQVADDVPRRILRVVDGSAGVYRWEDLPDERTRDLAPTLQIGDSEARALLEALARHYGGADDVRALRRDYDAERKRVDVLTSALVDVTRQLAEPPREAVTYSASFPGGLSEEAVTDAFKHAKRDGRR